MDFSAACSETTGGGYLYHAENNQVFVGLIIDLNYANLALSPFDEFQRMKSGLIAAQSVFDAITKGEAGTLLSSCKQDFKCSWLNRELKQIQAITYPKPYGILNFDKLSSVYLSNTHHDEDQPCLLQLADKNIPLTVNLPKFDEPAQRYCPAGEYEIIEEEAIRWFKIHPQNCIRCKACDIKDPSQNITRTVPEGGGGATYPNM